MSQDTLFGMLLRQRWWVSLLIGSGGYLALRVFLPAEVAIVAALPFLAIGALAAWRQLRVPSGARLEAALERVRALSWEACAAALEKSYRRDGFSVTRLEGAADFELEKAGRRLLISAKRWKAAHSGIEPLRELHEAGARRGDVACVYLFAGEISDNARAFAMEKKIWLLDGAELVKLVETG